MTLKNALQKWADVRAFTVRETTRVYHAEIIAHILSRWPDPDVLAANISDAQILDFAKLVAHFSATRWNGIVTMLRGTVPAAKLLCRRRVECQDRTLPDQLQFQQLLAQADASKRTRAGLVIRFLAFTGMRIAEARKLRWVDVGTDWILSPAATAKNGRPRAIPILAALRETLDRLRAAGDGVHVLPQADARKAIGRACVAVGLRPLAHHDFRHLFATRCIESGVDAPTVARWLGHRDGGALLAKRYFHLADAHGREMAAKVKIV